MALADCSAQLCILPAGRPVQPSLSQGRYAHAAQNMHVCAAFMCTAVRPAVIIHKGHAVLQRNRG